MNCFQLESDHLISWRVKVTKTACLTWKYWNSGRFWLFLSLIIFFPSHYQLTHFNTFPNTAMCTNFIYWPLFIFYGSCLKNIFPGLWDISENTPWSINFHITYTGIHKHIAFPCIPPLLPFFLLVTPHILSFPPASSSPSQLFTNLSFICLPSSAILIIYFMFNPPFFTVKTLCKSISPCAFP